MLGHVRSGNVRLGDVGPGRSGYVWLGHIRSVQYMLGQVMPG